MSRVGELAKHHGKACWRWPLASAPYDTISRGMTMAAPIQLAKAAKPTDQGLGFRVLVYIPYQKPYRSPIYPKLLTCSFL